MVSAPPRKSTSAAHIPGVCGHTRVGTSVPFLDVDRRRGQIYGFYKAKGGDGILGA